MPDTKAPPGLARLVTGGFHLGLGALSLAEARTWSMYIAALIATEAGHVAAVPALTLLLPERRPSVAGRAGALLGGAAALLLLSPLARAAVTATHVPGALAAAFGAVPPRSRPGAPPRPAPLVPTDLAGIKLPSVHVESHVYVTRDDGPLNLDLYRPHTLDTPAPCIVHIHGGAWEHGGPGDWPQIHRYLASRGYVVASIDYRKAPAHRFPAPQEDVGAALSFLKANAALFRLDPRRFVLTGRSAGGQIALLAAYTGDTSIRGVVGLYAPTDMRFGYEHPARKAVLDSCSVLSSYLGGTPGTIPQVYTNASPIDRVGPATPPTLLIHGSRDEVVWVQQSRRLAKRLHRAGRPHLLLELPWATHGMDILIGTPGGQICTYAIERFVAAVTG